MLNKFLQQIRYRLMARQLRRPRGAAGDKVGLMMNRANEFLYEHTLSVLHLSPGDHILEIGFGNGRFFEKLFARAGDLQVRGIDLSPTMVKSARRFNQEHIASAKLELCEGNSDALPYPADSMDHVFCINVIYFWDDPLPHLAEIRRVLKPGGRFLATARTAGSLDQMPFTRYGFKKYDTQSWKTVLESAGFILEKIHPVDEPQVELKGQTILVRSVCYEAVKPG